MAQKWNEWLRLDALNTFLKLGCKSELNWLCYRQLTPVATLLSKKDVAQWPVNMLYPNVQPIDIINAVSLIIAVSIVWRVVILLLSFNILYLYGWRAVLKLWHSLNTLYLNSWPIRRINAVVPIIVVSKCPTHSDTCALVEHITYKCLAHWQNRYRWSNNDRILMSDPVWQFGSCSPYCI